VNLLRKRDGRIEAFSESKLCGAIEKALGVGPEKKELARELARSVAFFVARSSSRRGLQSPGLIASAELAEATLTALRETGHGDAAERYQSYASWRAGAREQVRIEGQPGLEVFGEDGLEGWSKGRVAEDLKSLGLRANEARDTAAGVEKRIFASGLIRVSKDLLRHMINAELASRGFAARLSEARRLGPRTRDLERALEQGAARAPQRLEERILAQVLRRYQLEAGLPSEAALAIEHGALAFLGLDHPLRAQAVTIPAELSIHELPKCLEEARGLCFGELLWRPDRAARERLLSLSELESEFLRAEASKPIPLRIIGPRSLISLNFPESICDSRASSPSPSTKLPRSHAWRLPGRARARVELAFLNLRRCALLVGRGELEDFLSAVERLLRQAVLGLTARVESFATLVLEPDLPLWRPIQSEASGRSFCGLRELCAGISISGLHGALSFLTGESLNESAKVFELAMLVLTRLRRSLEMESRGRTWRLEFLDWPKNPSLSLEFSQADLLACGEVSDDFRRDYSLGLNLGLSLEQRALLAEAWGVRALRAE
jgi:hypothetical protein